MLARDLDVRLRSDGLDVVPASGAVMQRPGSFDWAHRNPFGRILLANAIERRLAIVSKDATLDTAPGTTVPRIW